MMYSRYTPNGAGGYDRRRIPHRPPPPDPPAPVCPPPPPPPLKPPPPPRPPGFLTNLLPGKLDKGDLLMLAILYLVFSEEDDDRLLPLLAVGLYLILK